MVKKVIIEFLLVPESLDKLFDEIRDEILKELNEGFLVIPWTVKIGKVSVVDNSNETPALSM